MINYQKAIIYFVSKIRNPKRLQRIYQLVRHLYLSEED